MGKNILFGFSQRTYLQTILLLNTILFAAILITGCEELIVVGGKEPTINFQEGTIEGIKTGDDTTTVIQKLGRPDWIGWGDIDGFTFFYKHKDHPGNAMLYVGFVNMHMYDSLIAPHTYLVSGISATKLYSGKSKEGIGVGTQRNIVRHFFGNSPYFTDESSDWFEINVQQDEKLSKVVCIFLYDDIKNVEQIHIHFKIRQFNL